MFSTFFPAVGTFCLHAWSLFLKGLWFSCPLTFHPAAAEPRAGKLYSSSSYSVLSDSAVSCWCSGLTTARVQGPSIHIPVGGAFKVGTWGCVHSSHTFFFSFSYWNTSIDFSYFILDVRAVRIIHQKWSYAFWYIVLVLVAQLYLTLCDPMACGPPGSSVDGILQGRIRALKSWCFWTVVLEKTLESPLDCKEIQPVHPKGDQSWVFIGRTDVEAETPIHWPPDAKSWLIGKDPDAGKDWGQEEKGTTKDEMVGWHHRLGRHGFGWILEVGDGQGGLSCCGSWGRKESDTTEWLSWTELTLLQGIFPDLGIEPVSPAL